MLKLKRIAITGGVASGKSTVCRILENCGAYALNSDQIIHQLLSEEPFYINEVIKQIGISILTDGQLDRSKIAEVVFNDRKKLEALEKILHPKVFIEINRRYWIAEQKAYALFVVEIPLIQELGEADQFDAVVAVFSSEKNARKRFAERGESPQMYDKRMCRQWNPEEKAAKADYVIKNDGTVEELENNVVEMMKEISSQ